MNRKIIIKNTEYKMEKMSADTYMDYLELTEQTESHQRYTRQDIEAMTLFICKAYGNQFTPEELKDIENGGIDAAGIILEFRFIDAAMAEELGKRVEKIQKNFTTGK
nr:MAG: hypothetical protein [Bacteriophage sp.]